MYNILTLAFACPKDNKPKKSICSYQFNIWYAGHSPAHILI